MKRGEYEQGRKISKPPPVLSNGMDDHQNNLPLGTGLLIRFGSM
jgi:hypothetical protein